MSNGKLSTWLCQTTTKEPSWCMAAAAADCFPLVFVLTSIGKPTGKPSFPKRCAEMPAESAAVRPSQATTKSPAAFRATAGSY